MRRPRPRHLYRLARDQVARDRWRRERFLDAAAARGVDAVGIRDARGHRYFVDPHDHVIGRLLFLEGTYEHSILDRALDVLGTEPDQILDIGANIGTVTVELLTRFPDARGVAFEPDARNADLLTLNLLANDVLKRTSIMRVALGDADGTVQLETSDDNFGDHRIRVNADVGRFGEERRPTHTVPIRRLDSLVRDGDVAMTDRTIISLDAQGHEGHILEGGPMLLGHPAIVEFWPYALRRAGGYDRFLGAVESQVITVLCERPRVATVDALRSMDLRHGHVDLLLVPS